MFLTARIIGFMINISANADMFFILQNIKVGFYERYRRNDKDKMRDRSG